MLRLLPDTPLPIVILIPITNPDGRDTSGKNNLLARSDFVYDFYRALSSLARHHLHAVDLHKNPDPTFWPTDEILVA